VIRREALKGGAQVKVTFVLPVDGAANGKVAVAGSFNGWDPAATVLRKRGATRSASVTLEAGERHAFRYVDLAAGRWFNDDTADGYERNEYGEENSILDLARPG